MRPAWSIIFFTTISGLGLGLAGWIVLGLLPLMTQASVMGVGIGTLALIGVGLISSTFHLGHPERAWRALSQWRSSWLSREGVLAVIVMAGLAGWFAVAYGGGYVPFWANLVLLALIYVTVYATSMIYASLKTVARWHHPLTPVCYLMFAAAGGLLATLALLAILRLPITAALAQAAIVLMLSAWGVKLAWWRVAGMAPQQGSIESATGLGALGAVRPLMPPHTEENYLQHEMGFVVARKHADKLRMIALLLGGGLPVVILVLAPASAGALAVARWHHPLTPVCYLMFAAAGGLLATLALLAILRLPITAALAQAAIVLMLSAWGVKLAWWRVAGMAPQQGSIESATGLGALGAVRPLMPPHTEENYLQHEMGFVVARKHADKLRMIALLLGGGLPVVILVLAPASAGALAVAVLAHVAGMFVERWLFFAEAKHVVTLYYGEAA